MAAVGWFGGTRDVALAAGVAQVWQPKASDLPSVSAMCHECHTYNP